MIEISFCRKSSAKRAPAQTAPSKTNQNTSQKPISFVDLCAFKFHCIKNGIITGACRICDEHMIGALGGNEEMSIHQVQYMSERERGKENQSVLLLQVYTHARIHTFTH